MYVIVVHDPWDDDVVGTVGPFETLPEAENYRKNLSSLFGCLDVEDEEEERYGTDAVIYKMLDPKVAVVIKSKGNVQ
jgi:hypothetical protein